MLICFIFVIVYNTNIFINYVNWQYFILFYNLSYSFLLILNQGSRLILPTGRTCATNFLIWSHKHIIWSQFFIYLFIWYNIWLINACWWTFIIVYSYMVTKVFNPFFFISIICDLNFVTGIPFFAFTFKFAILVSRFTRKDNCLFCLYLYTPFTF